jgi:signal peptidase
MSIRKHLADVLGGLSLLIVVILAALTIVIPKATGAVPLAILTGSMEPRLPPGTLIVVRPTDPTDLAVGDVVTYQIRPGDPDLVTHRIVGVSVATNGSARYVLKGDNNSDADAEPVLPEQVKGRLWYAVPLLGFVSTALNGEARGWIIPVLAALLLLYAAYALTSGTVTAVRRRRAEEGAVTGSHHYSDLM